MSLSYSLTAQDGNGLVFTLSDALVVQTAIGPTTPVAGIPSGYLLTNAAGVVGGRDPATVGGGGGGVVTVTGETPAGLVNGSNATFASLSPFVAGTVEVFANGLALRTPTDFVTSGTTAITLTSSPGTGESIRINYRVP